MVVAVKIGSLMQNDYEKHSNVNVLLPIIIGLAVL